MLIRGTGRLNQSWIVLVFQIWKNQWLFQLEQQMGLILETTMVTIMNRIQDQLYQALLSYKELNKGKSSNQIE